MNNEYDVIVVGAGNGGLVAAATCAKAGLKTLVLERHNLPGGCATSFVRNRFEFEPSLHELCTVGNKQHPNLVYNIFSNLGVKDDWRYEHNMFRAIVTGENGYDVTVKATGDNPWSSFVDSIEKACPGSKDGVNEILNLTNKCHKAIEYITAKKGKPNKIVLLLKHTDFMRCAGHSVEQVMDALNIPKKAQNIINTYWGYLGVPTDELNSFHFFNMLTSYVLDGAAVPSHKSHELSLSLADVIYKNGGQIFFNSEVDKFLYDDNNQVIGVRANGVEYKAKQVISNAIANNVWNMSPEEKVNIHSRKLANARSFGISVATIYLGLDCKASDLGIKDYTTFIMSDANPRAQYDQRKEYGLYIVNCLNVVIPESSPKNTCTLFFTIPVFGDDVPKNLTPKQYKMYKERIADKYISHYEKLMNIDIKSHIEEIEVATPVTFARYLGTPEGTIYGYKTSGWDSILARINSEKSDFTTPNLNFVGGSYVRGDGYSCAYYTGDLIGRRIVKKLTKQNNQEAK